MNNVNSPLTLRWNYIVSQYKVSKPNDQSGHYVDLDVAKQLLAACERAEAWIGKVMSEYPHLMEREDAADANMIIEAIRMARR